MSQAHKLPEPGMEDLLASIRKAINDDSTARSAAAPASPGTGGAAREAPPGGVEHRRPPADRPQSEILELRNRIAGQLTERMHVSPPPRLSGFAGILSGNSVRPQPAAASGETQPSKGEEQPRMSQAPALRQSYSDSERETADLSPSVEEPRYPDPPNDSDEPVRDEPGIPPSYRWAREPAYSPASLPGPHRYGSAPRDAGMLSREAAAGAEAAFSRLADSLMSRATTERSIEDVTRELLKPMLKQWLDEHLPLVVERLVREEIERVARRGGR
jgi:uncharacterized protein